MTTTINDVKKEIEEIQDHTQCDAKEMGKFFRYVNGKLYVNKGYRSLLPFSECVELLSGIEKRKGLKAWVGIIPPHNKDPDFINVGLLLENDELRFSIHISNVVLVS
jgi:hypothetical protein